MRQEDEARARQERVRMPELRCAGPRPAGERVLGGVDVGAAIALEDEYAVEVPGEEARRRESGDAAAEDDGLGRVAHQTWFRSISSFGCGSRYTWSARYDTPWRRTWWRSSVSGTTSGTRPRR